jgi:hypothetical protein
MGVNINRKFNFFAVKSITARKIKKGARENLGAYWVDIDKGELFLAARTL